MTIPLHPESLEKTGGPKWSPGTIYIAHPTMPYPVSGFVYKGLGVKNQKIYCRFAERPTPSYVDRLASWQWT
jgi:hypothetical protein